MSKKKMIIAGNWKMNNDRRSAKSLIEELKPQVLGADCEVVVCVPFTDLETVVAAANGSNIKVGAQNCHFKDKGAYTGEISAPMLKELGVDYVILGHSERRQYFGETDAVVNLRVKAALEHGLKAILCVGETLEQRENEITNEVVASQVKIALKGIKSQDMGDIIIAYEPVWAIGTGLSATAQQAQIVCKTIREIVNNLYGETVSADLVIQYGGSMNGENCKQLLAEKDIDGGLIGGASLKAADFAKIVDAASVQ